MDGRMKVGREEGMSGEGSCPADRQAATCWSHLATQGQPEMMGRLRICNVLSPLFSPKGFWDGVSAAGLHGGERQRLHHSEK